MSQQFPCAEQTHNETHNRKIYKHVASLVILDLLGDGSHSAALGSGQLQAAISVLLNVRAAGLSILTVFLCLGTIVFCYLFFASRYIPRWLAVWGMLASLLMLVVTFTDILLPTLPEAIPTASVVPFALFEVVVGLWLILRGVNVQRSH